MPEIQIPCNKTLCSKKRMRQKKSGFYVSTIKLHERNVSCMNGFSNNYVKMKK